MPPSRSNRRRADDHDSKTPSSSSPPSSSPSKSNPAASRGEGSEANDWRAVEGTIADRRVLPDRRRMMDASGSAGDGETGLERRRGPGRRRSDMMRDAEEGEMSREQFLFLMAIDAFKRVNNVTYPTWSDILEILRRLGYRKVQPSQINLPNAEDWTERPDAPLSVGSLGHAGSRSADDEEDDVDDEDDDDAAVDFDDFDAFEDAA